MRGTLAWLATTALLAPACRTAPAARNAGAPPPANSCTIVGGPRAPAVVKVYESPPYGQPGGKRIYAGSLSWNERHLIESSTGRIWYSYAWHELDSWKEGSEVPCRDGAEVMLP
jgi:hypothetical protein